MRPPVRSRFIRLALCLVMALFSVAASAQPVTDLVFCIDGSGSIDDNEWLLQLLGTAAALADPSIVPQNGTIRITIIQFSSDTDPTPAVGPVIIDDTNAGSVSAQVTNIQQLGGSTNPSSCIDVALGVLQNAMPPSSNWVIDISTDGNPNEPGTNAQAAQAALDSAANAMANGVDQINALGVGLSDTGLAFLNDLVLPQGSSNPNDDGFVIAIEDFAAYAQAIAQKIAAELHHCATFDGVETECRTDGSGDFDVTFTFTNHLVDAAGAPVAVTNLWLDNAWLLDAAGNTLPDTVTITPNYFSFAADPICSTADPLCTNPSRTLSVTVSGASAGETVRIEVATHDDEENCCFELFDIPVPDCDCLQILDERTKCLWPSPPSFGPRRFWNFTLQNLHPTLTVTGIKLEPIDPPYPLIQFDPNSINGLSLAPPPIAGTTNQWVEVTGPAATGGAHVTFRIRTYSGGQTCCVIEHEITLPYCKAIPVPYPWPDDRIRIEALERSILVTGFGRDADSGVRFETGKAGGVVVTWHDPGTTAAGAVVELHAEALVGGRPAALATLSLRSDGGSVAVLPSSGGTTMSRVELYAAGRLIGEGTDAAVAGFRTASWPTAAAFDHGEGAVAVLFERPTAIEVGAADPVLVDEAVFYAADGPANDGIAAVTVTAGSLASLEIAAAAHPIDE